MTYNQLMIKDRIRKKYPRETVVMNEQLHSSFVQKCREMGEGKSSVLNALAQKWVDGKVKIKL